MYTLVSLYIIAAVTTFAALLVFCPAKTFAGSVCVSLLGGIFWPVTVQVVLWKIAKDRIAKPGGLQ